MPWNIVFASGGLDSENGGMEPLVDRIVIAVPQLAPALAEYGQLFAAVGRPAPVAGAGGRAWLAVGNTVLELREEAVERPRISGLVFSVEGAGQIERELGNSRQLQLGVCDGQASRRFRSEHPDAIDESVSVDHIVLRTGDAEACIALFAQELGIRLALDKTVPEWGGRMLFFRTGKLTLEVIEAAEAQPGGDFFWGIALQCPHIEEAATRLNGRGVVLSELRDGRKPGTRVMTLKSHNLGIPTLLIEPTASG